MYSVFITNNQGRSKSPTNQQERDVSIYSVLKTKKVYAPYRKERYALSFSLGKNCQGYDIYGRRLAKPYDQPRNFFDNYYVSIITETNPATGRERRTHFEVLKGAVCVAKFKTLRQVEKYIQNICDQYNRERGII
jgi:hypothetical protein